MEEYLKDKKWKSKTSKEDGMGKDVDSARVRRNKKSCGYGREKKEDERIGDDRKVYSVGVCIYGK